jgi:hypothetical protein
MEPPHDWEKVPVDPRRCRETWKGSELGSTMTPPTILSSGMSWYFPFMMTEAGRRGIIMRFGIATYRFINDIHRNASL